MITISFESTKSGGKSTLQFASDPESLVDRVREELPKHTHVPEVQMSQIVNFAANIQDVVVRNNPMHLKCVHDWAGYAAITSMTIEVK
jgi:hypothetical protein